MKKNWEKKRLGEVCEIKPPKNEAKGRLNNDDLVSFVPMEDLEIFAKDFTATKERLLKEVSGSYTYFSNGDVLLAKITPCFENGKIGIARNLKNGIGFGSSEYIVFRTRGELTPEYLYYFLARDEFRQSGEKVMTGAVGHKRVPKDFIESQEISYPKSIPEQQRIVAILDEAFAAIAKAKEKAEKNLQNARELFDSYLQGVFASPGDGWEEKRLGELCEKITKGSSPNWQGIRYVDKPGILFITSENVGENKIILEKRKYVEERFNISDKKSILQHGDVLTNIVGASIGRTAVYTLNEIANINQAVCVLRCKLGDLCNLYLMHLLNSPFFKKILHDNEIDNARANLSLGFFSNLSIPVPPFPEQQRIVAKLDALSAETKKLEAIYEKKLDSLDELKKSILQKAFNNGL